VTQEEDNISRESQNISDLYKSVSV